MGTHLESIAMALPSRTLSNDEVASAIGTWSAEQIETKTGIRQRHTADASECASDLATAAAQKLLGSWDGSVSDIGLLLFVTQCPDHYLPASACIIQERLRLPTSVAAFDINQGCSGFVYGLAIAHSWLEAGLASKALLLTGDTYTRLLAPDDRGTRPLFGDGATATLLTHRDGAAGVGGFVFGTDGAGASRLIVPTGGFRQPCDGATHPQPLLHMDGPAVFSFTLDAVPAAVEACLERSGCTLDDVDLFVLHQANKFMVEHLVDKCGIPREKAPLCMAEVGNTVSSTIPMALHELARTGRLAGARRLMFVGFGVGYSWAAAMYTLEGSITHA